MNNYLKEVSKVVGRLTSFTFIFWVQDDDVDTSQRILFDFLNDLMLPSCVSPLHDQDVNEVNSDTGEIEFKKKHWHVDIDANATKSLKQWYDYLDPIRDFISLVPIDNTEKCFDDILNAFKLAHIVKNTRSLLRYFKHLDNPEKHQYIDEEYTCFGGFDLTRAVLSQTDTKFILLDMIDFIRHNECYSFCDFVDYCMINNREWFNVVSSNATALFILQYMKSRAFKDTGAQDRQIEKYEEYANN